MFPTPYPELNQVLADLLTAVRASLGRDLLGAYLQGSFAIGGCDEHSDVDFVTLVRDELTEAQIEALQETHGQVYDLESQWAKHLEGSYFPLHTFRDQPRHGALLWYLDHGARHLIRSDHCNTLIVRWTVRERGVALYGPPPHTLRAPIPASSLRDEIFSTITTWGHEILHDPARFSNRFYQGFILLSYCRMLHDLHRGYPGSKREGAEWVKSEMGPTWTALIDRAWDTRRDPARAVREPADPKDFERTLQFVEIVIAKSEHFVGSGRAKSDCA